MNITSLFCDKADGWMDGNERKCLGTGNGVEAGE